MAGGGGGLTDSILEVPTFTLALVFVFFLVVSVIFEKTVHILKHFFTKWGRIGLVEALEKLVMEVTLLGFISLLLLMLESSIDKICVSYNSAAADWTLISHINGCPCCLSNTAGISTCAQISHGCLFNVTNDNEFTPYCGCHEGMDPAYVDAYCSDYNKSEVQYLLGGSLTVFSDLSGFVSEHTSLDACQAAYSLADATCNNTTTAGFEEEVTETQSRRLLSLTAGPLALGGISQLPSSLSTKASAAVTAVTAAGAPLRRLLSGEASEGGSEGSAEGEEGETESHIVPELSHFECTGPFLAGECPEGKVPMISSHAMEQVHLWIFLIAMMHVAAAVALLVLPYLRMTEWRWWQRAAAGGAAGSDTDGSSPKALGSPKDEDAEAGENTSAVSEAVPQSPKRGPVWEWACCILQSFNPRMVTKQQFLYIRQHHLATSREPQNFDFVTIMLLRLERDAAKVVGISLEMWLVVICWFLVAGVSGFMGAMFLWIGAAMLFFVNLILVSMLRTTCRGEGSSARAGRLGRLLAWWKPEYLLIPMRMVLFLCSLIYSSTIFLGWQFGWSSCFFDNDYGFWEVIPGLPWWTGHIMATVMIFGLCWVTIPAYTLAIHAQSAKAQAAHEEGELEQDLSKALEQKEAEVKTLAAENERLRRLLDAAAAAGHS